MNELVERLKPTKSKWWQPTTVENLDQFESETGYKLPPAYREFVVDFGFTLAMESWGFLRDGEIECAVDSFMGVAEGTGYGLHKNDFVLPRNVITIASSGGADIVMSLQVDFEHVYYVVIHELPHDAPFDTREQGSLLATSFQEFIDHVVIDEEV